MDAPVLINCGFRWIEESSIPEMTVEHHLLDKLKPRLQLAKQVENAQHKVKKEKHEKNWLKATAEAMDIDLDEDFVKDRYVARHPFALTLDHS